MLTYVQMNIHKGVLRSSSHSGPQTRNNPQKTNELRCICSIEDRNVKGRAIDKLNDMDAPHKNNIAYKNVDRKECVLYGFINIAFKNL